MPRSHVAVVSTTPETVLEDVRRCLVLSGLRERLRQRRRLTLCVEASWHRPIPGTHTQPWQLDGVLTFLRDERVPTDRIQVVVSGATDVESSHRVLDGNQLWGLLDRHEVPLAPRGGGAAVPVSDAFGPLGTLIPNGLTVPAALRDSELLLLPALKTHAQLGLAGGLAQMVRTLLPGIAVPDRYAPQVTVELLKLLGEFGGRGFVMMDGTVCGDGAGPRTVRPTIQNVLLAGGDPVAVDAVASRILGWDPHTVDTLRRCRETGVGAVDPGEVQIRGEDIDGIDLGFDTGSGLSVWAERMASSGGRPWGALGRVVQSGLWYPMVGQRMRRRYRKTPWGRLQSWYQQGEVRG